MTTDQPPMTMYDDSNVRKVLLNSFVQYCRQNKNARRSPNGYLPWSNFLKVFVEALNRAANVEMLLADGPINESGKLFLHACHALAGINAPVRYVSDDMAAAWEHTRLPRFNHNHPHILPAFVLFPPLKNRAFDVWPKNQIVAQVVMELADGGLLAVSLESQTKSARTVEIGFSSSLFLPDETFDNLQGTDRQAAALALNAWLIHTYEPELITAESAAKTAGAGFGRQGVNRAAPCAPTWIGRDFKVRRIAQAAASSEPGIKVRPHWRSGHWHTVRHGKGRQAERLQWYRPVYVNS